MLRLAWIIVAMGAISATLVHLRCRQIQARAEMHHLEANRLQVRRALWDQQIRLGDLTSPPNLRRLTADWPMEIIESGTLEPKSKTAAPAAPAAAAAGKKAHGVGQ